MKPLAPIEIEKLLLDPANPRLPEHFGKSNQDSLIEWIANQYNTLDVGRSIARYGFFASEPLIAVKKGRVFTIVEGNRRLTALKILTDDKQRQRITLDNESDWEELAADVDEISVVPVHVASGRREIAPLVGFRHIAGIEPWEPWAKARFVAREIEQERRSFSQTAAIVGEPESEVRAIYRNYRVAHDAEAKLGISAERAKAKFGFFARAMNSTGLREHIGAPAPGEITKTKPVLKISKKREVAELLSWLFGDESDDAVIRESRQISDLGKVVESDDGLEVLRATRDLDESLLASGGLKDRLLRRLYAADSALQKALSDVKRFKKDSDVKAAIRGCRKAVEDLEELV